MAELVNLHGVATDGDENLASGGANGSQANGTSRTSFKRDLESETRSALLCYSRTGQHSSIQQLLQKFAQPLKSNFENCNLWLRYGLVLALSRSAPQSAVEAFNECARIDPQDPLPAMLAAKLLLEDLDNPEAALKMANEAIQRCQRILASSSPPLNSAHQQQQEAQTNGQLLDCNGTSMKDATNEENGFHETTNLQTNGTLPTITTTPTKTITQDGGKQMNHHSNIPKLLSKCYLLASIINAYIYEREPESIKQFKLDNLKTSLSSLELAAKTYVDNHLVYFHMALHDVRSKSFTSAIENTRQAIKLNPQHLPSMQLLILALSALKLYDKALLLCESMLQEFEDNLLLLYIKCNLEQNLVKTRGYKSALATAQYMLKCIMRSSSSSSAASSSSNASSTTHESTLPSVTAATAVATTTTTKQSSSNLFSESGSSCIYRRGRQIESFQSELQVWLLVAEIFIRIGSISDAELCVDEASNHVDGALSYQVMFVWGLIAKAKNNLIGAKSFFQSCLALCPRHAKALQEIAHVYYLLGNHSTAEKFLRDSLDEDSECDKAWYYLSLVFIETNQHEKAKEASDRAQQLEDSAPVVPFSTISRLTLE